jgi:prophage antirepressor-like protein
MANIVSFRFDTQEVRVHADDKGNTWWEAQDVCSILDIHDVSKAVARLHLGEKRTSESRNVLIINESGLYRLIFRSNKPEAQRFQDWVFGEVLPAIRKTGEYKVAPVLPPASDPKTHLALIQQAHALLTALGQLTARDTLMLADQIRNVMQSGQRLLPAADTSQPAPAAYGFSVAERVEQLGYHLSRKQQAVLTPPLGKRVIQEWRSRYPNVPPPKETRWVDGAQRLVGWYAQEEASWVDTIIQSYFSQFPWITRTEPVL